MGSISFVIPPLLAMTSSALRKTKIYHLAVMQGVLLCCQRTDQDEGHSSHGSGGHFQVHNVCPLNSTNLVFCCVSPESLKRPTLMKVPKQAFWPKGTGTTTTRLLLAKQQRKEKRSFQMSRCSVVAIAWKYVISEVISANLP